jgi:hypothetical protein
MKKYRDIDVQSLDLRPSEHAREIIHGTHSFMEECVFPGEADYHAHRNVPSTVRTTTPCRRSSSRSRWRRASVGCGTSSSPRRPGSRSWSTR